MYTYFLDKVEIPLKRFDKKEIKHQKETNIHKNIK